MLITPEQYKEMPDSLKEMFTANDDSTKYMSDESELKGAKTNEKNNRIAAENLLKESQAQVALLSDQIKTNKNKSIEDSGDVDAIRASHLQILEDTKTANAAVLAGRDKQLNGLLLNSTVDTILNGLNPLDKAKPAIRTMLKARLSIEQGEQGSKVSILDSNGAPSAFNAEDLMQEYLKDPDMGYLLKGTNGSGGGANANGSNNGASGGQQISRADFDALNANAQRDFAINRENTITD